MTLWSNRAAWTLSALALAACGVSSNDERIGSDPEASVADHGSDQPWVECRSRTQRAGTDPLGPVVSHGYSEAPNGAYPLDSQQQTFLGSGSLRLGTDGGMNTVLWEDLTLPVASPTNAQVESWVTAAIKVTGKRVPTTVTVTGTRATPTDDGTGRAIPSFTIWDLAFLYGGVAVMGSACSLVTQVGTTYPATLACRLEPGNATVRYESFTVATLAQAEQAALTATGTTEVLTSSKRYEIVNGATSSPYGRARFSVHVSDGTTDKVVLLDLSANVLGSNSIMRSLVFKGVDLDYLTAQGIVTLTAPIDANPNAVSLDSWPVNPPMGQTLCDVSSTAKKDLGGFAVCSNAGSGTSVTKNSVQTNLLVPTASNDFTQRTDTTVSCPTCPGGVAPGIPSPNAVADANGNVLFTASWADNPQSPQASHAHWAELQAFYSVGTLQKRYQLLGLPDRCKIAPSACSGGNTFGAGQAPFRIEVRVHDQVIGDATWAPKTGLTTLRIGDAGNASGNTAVETVADATVMAHEFNHYVLSAIEADPGNGWFHNLVDACSHCGASSMCTSVSGGRDILHEGLADSFAALFTGEEKFLPSFSTPFGAPQPSPCADPDNYPNNPLGTTAQKLQRNVCNNVVYGYWDGTGNGDCPIGSPDYVANLSESHRRGTIILGALFQFMKRYKDAGYGWIVPGMHMYEAQKRLLLPYDDERSYLDALISTAVLSKATKRFTPLAQVAFAEKNVFPTASCEPGCTAQETAQRRLTVAGPITSDPAQGAPEFKAFIPQGAAYESTARFELSDNPAFDGVNGVMTYQDLPQVVTPHNNSPAGFRRFTPDLATVWGPVKAQALLNTDKRVYYRVRQCQTGGTLCVNTTPFTTSENQPYVWLVPYVPVVTGCSYGSGATGGGLGALLIVGSGLLIARSRRRRGRSDA